MESSASPHVDGVVVLCPFVTGQVTWMPVATSKGPQSSEVLSFSGGPLAPALA